jgi:hypothetical protein
MHDKCCAVPRGRRTRSGARGRGRRGGDDIERDDERDDRDFEDEDDDDEDEEDDRGPPGERDQDPMAGPGVDTIADAYSQRRGGKRARSPKRRGAAKKPRERRRHRAPKKATEKDAFDA